MGMTNKGAGGTPRDREALAVGALLLLLFLVNVLTADLFPVVWLDEALHVDPAVSLFRGEGLRSTTWGGQPVTETWVGYTPLFAIALAGWMRLFGFGLTVVRAFGHALGLVAVGAVWLGVRRHGLLRTSRARLLLVLLASCGAGASFSYRCGRPDPLLFLLFAAGFLASTVRGRAARTGLLLSAGSLVPAAGFQGLAFAVLFGALVVLFVRGKALEAVLVFLSGCGLGLAAFVATLSGLGLWSRFREVTLAANGIGAGLLDAAAARLELFPQVAIEDPSTVLLLVLCVGTLALAAREGRGRSLAPALFGALAAVLVPTALCAAGRWALYYSWMSWVPLVVGTLVSMEALEGLHRPGRPFRLLLAASVLVGLPLQLALGLFDAKARSYRRVEEVVAAGVPHGAVAYCDAAAYYAVRARASRLFLPSYNRHLTAANLQSIDAVVLRTGDGFSWEKPHPAIEAAFRPLDVPAPPASRAKAFRLHWIYGDYATLRAWEKRPPAPLPSASAGR